MASKDNRSAVVTDKVDYKHNHKQPSTAPISSYSVVNEKKEYNTANNNNCDTKTQSSLNNTRVIREQYWVCGGRGLSCPTLRLRDWTKRERTFFYVVLGLSVIIIGLVVLIIFIQTGREPKFPHQQIIPWLQH